MPERTRKSQPRFSVQVILDVKQFERMEKLDTKWFKKYNERFGVVIDKKTLRERVSFVLSLISDFSCQVNIKFCDDLEIEKLNAKFRKKNEPTDVLSFPARPEHWEHVEDKVDMFLGDLIVCVPVCDWQAKDVAHSISDELEKMILHGLVHLKGFDHERGDAAWEVMSALEASLMRELKKHLGEPEWCRVEDVKTKGRG